jgi:uncharacterized membrane protein YhaH (DUF805 family)
MNWYLKVVKEHYADFSGRARRKEYWMFVLFQIIIAFVLGITAALCSSIEALSYSILILLGIYFLGTLIPTIAVTVRRLHDTGKSGWWYLISFLPYIGGFILLIFTCMDGEGKPNNWGENPKGIGNNAAINEIGRE